MMGKTTLLPFKTIPIDQAVGTTLAHDMTEIIPGISKGPVFPKGHKVKSDDLCRLMRMGKNKLYILDLKETQIHEDNAVMELAPALSGPGAMFLLGYNKNTSIMGLPACGLYHKTTIFDLILSRLMAGERPGKRDIAKLCHGGLCLNCNPCRFPTCPFGKSA